MKMIDHVMFKEHANNFSPVNDKLTLRVKAMVFMEKLSDDRMFR